MVVVKKSECERRSVMNNVIVKVADIPSTWEELKTLLSLSVPLKSFSALKSNEDVDGSCIVGRIVKKCMGRDGLLCVLEEVLWNGRVAGGPARLKASFAGLDAVAVDCADVKDVVVIFAGSVGIASSSTNHALHDVHVTVNRAVQNGNRNLIKMVLQPQSDLSNKRISSTTYTYSNISQLKVNTVAYLYGVVMSTSDMEVTLNGGHKMKVSLQDQSCPDKFTVYIFANFPTFPKVTVGCVLRLHRVLIHIFQGNFCGKIIQPEFVVVFYDLDGIGFDTLAKKPTMTKSDFVKVEALFKWHKSQLTLPNRLAKNDGVTLLKDITKEGFYDIFCQVVWQFPYRAKSGKCVALLLWDGTPGILGRKIFTASQELPIPVPDGYGMIVYVFDEHMVAAKKLKTNDMVLLRNVHVNDPKRQAGEEPYFYISMHGGGGRFKRGITLVDPASQQGVELHRRLQEVIDRHRPPPQVSDPLPRSSLPQKRCAAQQSEMVSDETSKTLSSGFERPLANSKTTHGLQDQKRLRISEGEITKPNHQDIKSAILEDGASPRSNETIYVSCNSQLSSNGSPSLLDGDKSVTPKDIVPESVPSAVDSVQEYHTPCSTVPETCNSRDESSARPSSSCFVVPQTVSETFSPFRAFLDSDSSAVPCKSWVNPAYEISLSCQDAAGPSNRDDDEPNGAESRALSEHDLGLLSIKFECLAKNLTKLMEKKWCKEGDILYDDDAERLQCSRLSETVVTVSQGSVHHVGSTTSLSSPMEDAAAEHSSVVEREMLPVVEEMHEGSEMVDVASSTSSSPIVRSPRNRKKIEYYDSSD